MFTILSTLIFLALTLMWRTNDGINLGIKLFLGVMTFWGAFLIGYNMGAF